MELDVNGKIYRVKRIRYENDKLTCDALRLKDGKWSQVHEKNVIKLLANLSIKQLGNIKVPAVSQDELDQMLTDMLKAHLHPKRKMRRVG